MRSMQCTNCGHELLPGAEFCGNCGAKIMLQTAPNPQPTVTAAPPAAVEPMAPAPLPTAQSPAPAPQPEPVPAPVPSAPAPAAPTATPLAYAPAPGQQTAYAVPMQPRSGLSVASLVLGIIGVISILLWFFAAPLGILALIFGLIGRNKGGKGMATAGIILGAIALVGTIIITAVAVNYVSSHPDTKGTSGLSIFQ